MASEQLFSEIPPFPEDAQTLPMATISLASLQAGDAATAQQLLRACQELGFFLLDLRDDEIGGAMTSEIDQLFRLGKRLFDLPDDVKTQYLHDIPRSFLGYKPQGQAKTETGDPDRFEWFNIGQNGLMGTTELQSLPPLVEEQLPLCKSYLAHGQTLISAISTALATQLSLPSNAFTAMQSPVKLSGTVIRIIKAFARADDEKPRTSMIHHSDFGTITLLANVVGGLQILAPNKKASDENAWYWVRPQPRCLVVNIGDAMVQWTGGLLRSNIHRINYAPGEQKRVDRYSMAILARPEHEASMKPINGVECNDRWQDTDLNAWEWEVKKMMALKREGPAMESSGGIHLMG